MQVTNEIGPAVVTPARAMTKESIQQDFEYGIAQMICRKLFDDGLLDEAELQKVTELNRDSFKPIYADIM